MVRVSVIVGVLAAIGAVPHAAATSSDEIGFVFEHGSTLYTARADGTHERPLARIVKGAEHERSAAWSPDGRRLAYFGRAGRLTILEIQTGRARVVSTACSSSPSYARDGQRLLCADSNGTFLRQNGRERLIDSDEGAADDSVSEASFGPDGRIAAHRGEDLHIFRWRNGRLQHIRMLPRPFRDCWHEFQHGFSWSPDGRWLAVGLESVPCCRPNHAGIWLIPTGGGAARRITRDGVGVSWSPDGGWLAFASERSGDWEIYVVRTDGRDLRRITHRPGRDWAPLWRP
jgi:dipeptidyl aminopeptidase/acylaminoacyl peptidase